MPMVQSKETCHRYFALGNMPLVPNEREMLPVPRTRINEYPLLKEEKFVTIAKCEINITGERKTCLSWKEIKRMPPACIELGERHRLGATRI